MGFQLFSAIWVDLQEHELLLGILIRQPCSYLAIFLETKQGLSILSNQHVDWTVVGSTIFLE